MNYDAAIQYDQSGATYDAGSVVPASSAGGGGGPRRQKPKHNRGKVEDVAIAMLLLTEE